MSLLDKLYDETAWAEFAQYKSSHGNLSEKELAEYLEICSEIGLDALVEAHDEAEIRTALSVNASIIGVNNRNLKDFSVDKENSLKLRKMIPNDVLFVSESGIESADDIKYVREMGADAVLVGETMMRAADKKAKLNELKGI
jgi:indole-3-glycerol phosphate synthase